MLKKFSFLALLTMFISVQLFAQPERWQQQINYKIDAALDVQKNTIKGTEEILYTNNSTDTLRKVYFHMYWNAFQPNSNMDARSRELGKNTFTSRRGDEVKDWDMRVRDRIQNLKPEEYGIQKVNTITINGKSQQLIEHETILEVVLTQPVLPKSVVKMNVQFEAQVPVQIRRSGRDNKEGVRYSMSQWYPKMVEYDYQGWNTNPYIAREFYGVWGNYDVTLRMDKAYMVGGTGVLQNPTAPLDKDGNKVWNFKGNTIHDFVWFADNNFKHLSKEVRKGLTLHVYYKAKDAKADSAWANVLWAAEKALPFMEKKMGAYPYPQYSFIQGGDGGMEYAMATLLAGPGSMSFLITLYSNRSQNLGQAFWQDTAAIIAIIIVAISIYFIFKFAPRLMKYTGQAGLTSLSKVMGFIVIGIGVQMIISSISSIVKNIVLELNNIP